MRFLHEISPNLYLIVSVTLITITIAIVILFFREIYFCNVSFDVGGFHWLHGDSLDYLKIPKWRDPFTFFAEWNTCYQILIFSISIKCLFPLLNGFIVLLGRLTLYWQWLLILKCCLLLVKKGLDHVDICQNGQFIAQVDLVFYS